MARPIRTDGALSFAIELKSLCSGWTLTLEEPSQVERLLALLSEQAATAGGDRAPETALP